MCVSISDVFELEERNAFTRRGHEIFSVAAFCDKLGTNEYCNSDPDAGVEPQVDWPSERSLVL